MKTSDCITRPLYGHTAAACLPLPGHPIRCDTVQPPPHVVSTALHHATSSRHTSPVTFALYPVACTGDGVRGTRCDEKLALLLPHILAVSTLSMVKAKQGYGTAGCSMLKSPTTRRPTLAAQLGSNRPFRSWSLGRFPSNWQIRIVPNNDQCVRLD